MRTVQFVNDLSPSDDAYGKFSWGWCLRFLRPELRAHGAIDHRTPGRFDRGRKVSEIFRIFRSESLT